MTLIYVIRHAQASWGAADYDKLSPLGRRQSGALGQRLAELDFKPDMVFTGRMRRHRDTAALCLEQLAVYPDLVTLSDLDEYDFQNVFSVQNPGFSDLASAGGDDEVRTLIGDALRAWTSDAGQADQRYSETFSAFRARARRGLDEMAAQAMAKGAERVLAFTSGGPAGAITLDVLDAPSPMFAEVAWRIANCGVTKLTVVQEQERPAAIRLVAFNDFSAMEKQPGENEPGLLTFR